MPGQNRPSTINQRGYIQVIYFKKTLIVITVLHNSNSRTVCLTVNILPMIAAPANPPIDPDSTQVNTAMTTEQQSSEVSMLEYVSGVAS